MQKEINLIKLLGIFLAVFSGVMFIGLAEHISYSSFGFDEDSLPLFLKIAVFLCWALSAVCFDTLGFKTLTPLLFAVVFAVVGAAVTVMCYHWVFPTSTPWILFYIGAPFMVGYICWELFKKKPPVDKKKFIIN